MNLSLFGYQIGQGNRLHGRQSRFALHTDRGEFLEEDKTDGLQLHK